MEEFSDLKIVEIGHHPSLKQVFPEQVLFFSTSSDDFAPERAEKAGSSESLGSLSKLWRALRHPDTSLIICRPTFFSPWHWRWLSRVLFDRRILPRLALFPRAFGPQLLRWRTPAPLVVWDDADIPLINRNNFFLLDRCRVYFKRELPTDRWRLFMKVSHPNLPTTRFRKLASYHTRIDKLRPISLGPGDAAEQSIPGPMEKSTDIFFAGKIEGSSSVRTMGLPELLALRERGFVVDVPEQPLSREEFYRRCAQARLTWSPEGYGWDCFRHYEAALCRSVPLINCPTIERYQPLIEGEHAVYYNVEKGGLTRAAVAALADKQRLLAMGHAARSHVLAHHTPAAVGRYIVHTALHWTSAGG